MQGVGCGMQRADYYGMQRVAYVIMACRVRTPTVEGSSGGLLCGEPVSQDTTS